jgi:hypothetical protein
MLNRYIGSMAIRHDKERRPRTIRKTLRVRDIPSSWNVALSGDPDAPVTVVVTPSSVAAGRPLVSYIGAGRGIYRSPAEVDEDIRHSRDAWER